MSERLLRQNRSQGNEKTFNIAGIYILHVRARLYSATVMSIWRPGFIYGSFVLLY